MHRRCIYTRHYTRAQEIISTHAHSMLLINRERENKNRATIYSASVFSRAKSRAWKRPLSIIHVRFFSSPKSARFRLHGKRTLRRHIDAVASSLNRPSCSTTTSNDKVFLKCIWVTNTNAR